MHDKGYGIWIQNFYLFIYFNITLSLGKKKKKNERGTELVPHFMYKLHTWKEQQQQQQHLSHINQKTCGVLLFLALNLSSNNRRNSFLI